MLLLLHLCTSVLTLLFNILLLLLCIRMLNYLAFYCCCSFAFDSCCSEFHFGCSFDVCHCDYLGPFLGFIYISIRYRCQSCYLCERRNKDRWIFSGSELRDRSMGKKEARDIPIKNIFPVNLSCSVY